MRTENERWRERGGEKWRWRVSSTESDGTDVERERRETDKEAKTGIKTDSLKIRGREKDRRVYMTLGFTGSRSVSLSVSLFLYLVVINGQIRTVLRKCKSAGGEIKPF